MTNEETIRAVIRWAAETRRMAIECLKIGGCVRELIRQREELLLQLRDGSEAPR